MSKPIRTFGDPVLTSRAAPVTDVDGRIVRLVDEMFDSLIDSGNGLALAAPQIGVQKQVVVWDLGDEPLAIVNPEIVESDGEWVYDEGCLSIPGLYVEMLRPKTVLVRGVDLDGNPIQFEADELEARMFQHEIDHLNGVLMFDRMTADQRKEALAEYRRIERARADEAATGGTVRRRLRLG
jgi:peptide deformylase